MAMVGLAACSATRLERAATDGRDAALEVALGVDEGEDEGATTAGDATSDEWDETDAARLDADVAEASGADALSDGAPTGCAGLFCEDFEDGALAAAKWLVTSGVNHVDDATPPTVVEEGRAAHGRFAAHFHGKGNVANDDVFIVTKTLPPALATHHFGRLYFYVSTKPTSGHTMWVVGGSAGMSANPKLRDFEVATINGGWQLCFDQFGMSPSGEEVFYPQGTVPVAKWTCLEWELDDQPDSDTLWIDGKAMGTLDDRHVDYPPGHAPGTPLFDGKSAALIGGFTTYSFGFYDWHPNADFDLYLDDLVLDTKRVGCL